MLLSARQEYSIGSVDEDSSPQPPPSPALPRPRHSFVSMLPLSQRNEKALLVDVQMSAEYC